MNPNDPANLDPKLKEAYERIMGTSPTAATQPQAPSQPQPFQQNQPPQPDNTAPQAPQMETQTVEEQTPAPNLTPSPDFSSDIPDSPLSKSVNQNAEEVVNGDSPVKPVKKPNKFMPAILVLGGVVFFIIYSAIWALVFGIKLF